MKIIHEGMKIIHIEDTDCHLQVSMVVTWNSSSSFRIIGPFGERTITLAELAKRVHEETSREWMSDGGVLV